MTTPLEGIHLTALNDYLHAHIDSFEGIQTMEAFEAGQSNPTYVIQTSGKKYVLRRKPWGQLLPSAHAVDREYQVMSALAKVNFPVPPMYLYAEETAAVDTPFYVMGFVEGRIFTNVQMPDLTPDERKPIFEAMVQTMAKLHALVPEAIGLGNFGKQGNYFVRQIGRWSKQYKASETETIPEMDKLIDWLPQNIPADDETRVIHGDFGMHNLMFHPTEPRIVAVLDWELSTLGHPIADLTYNMLPWYTPSLKERPSFQGLDLQAHGIPAFEAYMNRYCELTGREPITNPAFYRAYNLFRFAAIAQGIVARALQGNASNARAIEMKEVVAPLAQRGWMEAQKA
jgi:aminoglycoside phosphotransferase (APT) family kinase protein